MNALSPRTIADLDRGRMTVIQVMCGERESEWPTEAFESALTRDGDLGVIELLVTKTASIVQALAQATHEKPDKVLRDMRIFSRRAPMPFSHLAWKRAHSLILHGIDGRKMKLRGGSIEAIDLVGGLVLIEVMGLVRLAGLEEAEESE